MTQVKRKAADLAVPSKGEDPEERKRVLNVLAQRRYRQRRKEHVKKLEAAAKSPQPQTTATSPSSPEAARNEVASGGENGATGSKEESQPIDASAFEKLDRAYPPAVFEQAVATSVAGALDDPFAYDLSYTVFPEDLQLSTQSDPWRLPSLPGSPSCLSSTHASSLTSFSSPVTDSTKSPTYDFPDEAHLEVLELALLRGATAIASRLGIRELIWQLDALSPFSDPLNSFADYSHLPPNLQPTALQRTQQHSPIIDLLPWPTVRDKLIHVLSAPVDLRPAIAATPTALVDFVYDLEDSAEGARIWGDDPYSDRNWEVGEKVFQGWWWAFDTEVVKRSNEMRSRRGARLLGQERGAVLGEVT
ncbi:uncharacterized protein HMPREF1541_00085 [Cyphellophora europaea CBS 101466]|uniref:BZIP domain-containing protein n=1 Tax=Cyphellophora europaea (strain CBS 101466) TaxID=1220924 RepID=W2SDE5_CYPE1|nr:uncharacterized protein HMPREF1541_00085 [Cyphellophora europaea CBS 101466]ETN45904.1 hypothetical protein HMPREF1541_00085 [Cyphellophora europaea CBS 101466]